MPYVATLPLSAVVLPSTGVRMHFYGHFATFPISAPRRLPLVASGGVWGSVWGCRRGVAGGLLNAVFLPFSPLAYGFVVRREKGRRAACWVLFCVASMVAWLLLAKSVLVE